MKLTEKLAKEYKSWHERDNDFSNFRMRDFIALINGALELFAEVARLRATLAKQPCEESIEVFDIGGSASCVGVINGSKHIDCGTCESCKARAALKEGC